jgi:hypothetical protein
MKVQTLPKTCFAHVTTLDITAQGCQYVRSTRTSGAEPLQYPCVKYTYRQRTVTHRPMNSNGKRYPDLQVCSNVPFDKLFALDYILWH